MYALRPQHRFIPMNQVIICQQVTFGAYSPWSSAHRQRGYRWSSEKPDSGRKEMFYLMTHSTHFIYGYMVKDHSDCERGNPLPPHRLLFPISSKGSFICTIPQTG